MPTVITLRSVKGEDLTPTEVDNNFASVLANKAETNNATLTNVTVNTATVNSPTINTMTAEGGTVNAATLTNISALTATGDLDIGTHELRAQTLEADVTTGTAPLTITSTTLVSNLNVDQVDNLDAADLKAFQGCIVTNQTSQSSIATNVATQVVMNTASYDPDSAHDAVNDEILVPAAWNGKIGVVSLMLRVSLTAVASELRVGISIGPGDAPIYFTREGLNTSENPYMLVRLETTLATNDRIAAWIDQNSGSDATLTGSGSGTFLTVEIIDPS
jgi:hypothetical protein